MYYVGGIVTRQYIGPTKMSKSKKKSPGRPPIDGESKVRLTVRVAPDLKAWYEQMAERGGTTAARIAETALAEFRRMHS